MDLRSVLACLALVLVLVPQFDAVAQDIDPFELKAKADRAVAIFQDRASQGRDLSAILPRMQQVKVLGDAGKLAEADALLDEILALLDAASGASPPTVDDEVFARNTEVRILGYEGDAMEAFLSHDSRYIFFNDEGENKDIYYAERIDDYTFQFKGEVANVNTKAVDGVPTMDREGNFYYVSTHAYGRNNLVTVYRGQFENGAIRDIRPVPELSLGKPGWLNMDIEISADGQTLYSTQTWFGDGSPPTKSYFFYARKSGDKFILQEDSPEIFKHINQDKVVYAATISNDELEILYTRLVGTGGAARFESLRATRPNKTSPFGRPKVIKAITGFSEAPALSDDGRLIYYHKKTAGPDGVFKLYVLHRRDQG